MEIPNNRFKNRKIKVCFVSYSIHSLFNSASDIRFGGSEIQIYLLLKELIKIKKFKLSVITGHNNLKKRIELFKNNKIYVVIPLKKKKIYYFIRPISLILYLINANPDIIIQRNLQISTGILALYCKLLKKKFIYSIASEIDVNGEATKGLSGKILNYGLMNAFFIVAQNNDQIIKLENWKKRKFKNIKVIRNGHYIKKVESDDKQEILWVGRADKWKKPEYFLRLAKNLPKERFVMICNEGQEKIYWNYISESAKNISNLKFINYVPFTKISSYFNRAKIFVNTSIYEGFPNTFIQAAINKTPILSLNVNPDNFISKYKCGYHCNNDYNKMESALNTLLTDKALYDSFSNNVYLYARKFHNIKKIVRQWVKLIETIYKNYRLLSY